MAATAQKLTIGLSEPQSRFRKSTALYRGFVGGRGAGKTWVGGYDLIMKGEKGRTYLVASPTYTILDDTTLPTFIAIARQLNVFESIKMTPRPNVVLSTGATFRFRSAEDPDALRGPNLSGASLDEASLMPYESYMVTIGCLREGGVQGWLSATFTPKGLSHWTRDVFATGRENTDLITSHTKENPFNPVGFAKTLETQFGALRARQELAGEFLTVEGAEWPAEWFGNSIWFDEWPKQYVCKAVGLDPSMGQSKDKGDDSAFAMVMLGKDGILYVDCDAERRPSNDICRRAIEINAEFKPDWIGVEVNQFQQLLANQMMDLAKEHNQLLPLHTVDNRVNKEVRIRRLTPFLSQGDMRFKRHSLGASKLVDQLRDFPCGKYDDCADSCEMAVRLISEQLGAHAKDNIRASQFTDEYR
jgi:predicted phage terminase large subunit-like protein